MATLGGADLLCVGGWNEEFLAGRPNSILDFGFSGRTPTSNSEFGILNSEFLDHRHFGFGIYWRGAAVGFVDSAARV